jgi:hypothetical protein
MKVLLAKKQTEEQIKSNEYVKFQFVMAMMNMDERMIGTLLKENGVFFGNKNNWQTLHWFKKQFKGLNNTFFNSRLKEGLSLDVYPGSIMFEFKYSALNTDNFDDDPFSVEYQEALFNSKDAITITLVLLFENGKITDIRIPKRIIELSKLKQLQTEN